MIDRRELLLGAAALTACAAQPRAPSPTPRRWAPFASTVAIDAASALDLLAWDIDNKTTAEIARANLEVAHACGLTAIVMTVSPTGKFWQNDAALEQSKAYLATIRGKIATYPDDLMLIQTAADLATAHRSHRLGVIFTFQGAEPLGDDPGRIAMFRALGVRVIQLTHNGRNLLGDGATEPGNAGLTGYGREVVERLNAARVVIDLAHGSQRTIRDGIAASKQPVLISHTGCRALSDLPRNTGDAELRALADQGGVAGMIFWPYLRKDTQPMAADLIAHIEHAIDVAGEDHVGLGGDASVVPVDPTPAFERENRALIAELVARGIFETGRPADLYMFLPDLNVANRYEVLATHLAARGHSDARIAKILGGNVARVLREVWG